MQQTINVNLSHNDMLSHIKPRLLSSEYQTDRLLDLVKTHLSADLYLTWYVDLTDLIPDVPADADPDCRKTAPVTYDLAKKLNLTIDELTALGNENSAQDYCARPMEDILHMLSGSSAPRDEDLPNLMYVLTNTQACFGASAILNTSIQQQMDSVFPQGYFCLPSSIHEYLVVGADENDPDMAQALAQMVHSINHNTDIMRPEEILSDHVFQIRDGALTAVV